MAFEGRSAGSPGADPSAFSEMADPVATTTKKAVASAVFVSLLARIRGSVETQSTKPNGSTRFQIGVEALAAQRPVGERGSRSEITRCALSVLGSRRKHDGNADIAVDPWGIERHRMTMTPDTQIDTGRCKLQVA